MPCLYHVITVGTLRTDNNRGSLQAHHENSQPDICMMAPINLYQRLWCFVNMTGILFKSHLQSPKRTDSFILLSQSLQTTVLHMRHDVETSFI